MTTPVGSIKLDLEIDGSDLPAEVLREIQAALAPVLADLQRRLDAVERDYADVTRAAEKSSAKQTAAIKTIAEAVEDVGDEHTKTAAKARAGATVSTRSINATTRALQRQIVEWDRLAAAKARAAAVPTPGAPPPRSGGGGGGGGGTHFSRGQSGSGGFFGFGGPITGAVGWNAVAAGIGSFPAAATAVTNLTGAIQQLVQVAAVAPGVIGGIVTSFGVATFAVDGMSDALEDVTEALKDGTPEAIAKAEKSLLHFAPSAREVIKTVAGLQEQITELRRDAQQPMFEGVAENIQQTFDKARPVVQKGLASVGKAWNGTINEVLRVGGSDSTLSLLDRIFGNTAEAQTRANKAIEPLIHAVGTLTAEGTDFLPRLADGLTALTTRFDNFITKSVANGDLDRWIDEGIEAAGHLGESILNIGKIITDITEAAGGDGGFLKWLEDATTGLHAFLSSDEGQAKLTEFFREGKEQLNQWLPILQNLGTIAVGVYDGMKQWADFLLPILKSITDVLASMPGGIAAVVTGFLAFKTIGAFTGLLGSLGSIGTALDKIDGKLGRKGAGGVLGKLGMLGAALALPAVLDTLNDVTSGEAQKPDAVRSAELIGGGALIGSRFGGVPGAIIGGGIGAGVAVAPVLVNGQWVDPNSAQKQGTLPTATSLGPGFRPGDRGGLTPRDPGYVAAQQHANDVLNATDAAQRARNGVPPVAPDVLKSIQDAATEAQIAGSNVEALGGAIKALPTGEVVLNDESPEVIERLKQLGLAVQNLPDGNLSVRVVFRDPNGNPIDPSQFRTPGFIPAFPGDTTKPKGGRAEGGVLPGYSPGVDNMLVPMSGGEGVIIPEAMRALGSRWLYNLNSSFRSGLSRRGYANGGVVGFADGGVPHLGTGDLPGDPVVGLLSEIRDLLAGKGGTASNPLAATAANTGQLSTAVDKADANGQQLGPFGTPIKPRHRGYEAAAAAIQALGGDPEKWLGADPATLPISQGGILPDQLGAIPGMPGAGGADYAKYAAVLAAFAKSGNLGPDLAALGLDANDPVIKAITTARNKKKGALGGDAIAALVDQVVGGGGYSGTLDSSNSALISALQTFRDKLGKPSRGSTAAAVSGLPIVGGGPKGSKAGLLPAASQLWDLIAANFPQVTEIGGVRQDPHPDHPSGRALDIMIPGGTTRGGANPAGKALGDQMWQFLVSNGLIDPTGSLWQTDTGGDHFNHIHARIAEGMENALNTSGLISPTASGLGAAGLTSSGGVVPVYVTNFDGQMRGGEFGKQIIDAAATAAGGAGADVAGDVLSAGMGVGHRPLPEDTVDASQLAAERNPNVFAALAGFQVGDYNRTGSQGQADNLMTNEGPGYNAQGQLYSDTTALLDRSFTSLSAQIKASFDQMQDVIGQVRDKLTEDALKPIVKAAVSEGVSEIKDAALASIGTTMGQSAGPPIADAVRSAIPSDSGSGGGEIANTVAAAVPGMAAGGPVYGGVPGKDSVPSLLMPGEHVLTTDDVSRMGGQAGVYAFRAALARNGGVRGFATGGGVIVNDTVGAEFFGVSQIPILGAIVNLLVRVLLAVLGVQIEARDTLNEMTSEFRQFRGDFQAFDATGRLLNDTSALMERSQSSEELAAQERIRILKIVLQALIKYIIEKVIVPIAKAVANAAINAGGAAAGAAINTQAPGAGGIVSSLISSAGTAGVDIAAEIGSEIAVQASAVIIDMVASGLQSYFPDAVGAIFGGGLMEQLIAAPITAALAMPLAILGSLTGGLGSLLAPLAAVLGGGGGLFDDGGVARGVGMMPKATLRPERVLNPEQTALFERMVTALERNRGGAAGPQTVVQIGEGAIQVAGGPEAGENVRNGLLELMRG